LEVNVIVTAFVTLFVIIDPIGLMPLFVAMTQGMDSKRRRIIALRACITAGALLTLFGLFGEAVLGFVGISMPAFRIAGGVLLFLTALDMLFERRSKRRGDQAAEATAEDDFDDPSIFPLATPLIAGPGSIATIILLIGEADGGLGMVAMLLTMLAVLLCVLVMFFSAGLVERALGPTGINVVTRLLGMLLCALAVQFILDGLKGFSLAAF
jgi:multiple antibiotic resistance protein